MPPLLAYIEAASRQVDHAQRRQDAEAAIGRLYEEQASLIAEDQAAPAQIQAANDAVLEISDEVAELEQTLGDAMEAGTEEPGQRQALADARGRMVEARCVLDQLTRAAAERTQRLTAISADIESWEARREKAAQALYNAKSRKVPANAKP